MDIKIEDAPIPHNEIDRLRATRDKMPGALVQENLNSLQSMKKITDGNYGQLNLLLEKIEAWGHNLNSGSITFDDFIDNFFTDVNNSEISRFLFNYLASVDALIDHMKEAAKQLRRNDKDIKMFQNKSHNYFFIVGLRNYFLHAGIPRKQIAINFGPPQKENPVLDSRPGFKTYKVYSSGPYGPTHTIKFEISREDLLKYGRGREEHFDVRSFKKYLERLENIDIKKEICGFSKELNRLYIYFYESTSKVFEKELKDLERIDAEIRSKEII